MKKAIGTILLIMFILFMFVPNTTLGASSNATTGHTAEEVGVQIANWAIQFYNEHQQQCYYDSTYGTPRELSYSAAIDNTTRYYFDCVGWISFAVHHATGIGNAYFTIFAQPQRGYGTTAFNGFYEYLQDVRIYSEQDALALGVRPGDVLVKSVNTGGCHVGLYVGNDTVIHSINSTYGNDLRIDTVAGFATGTGYNGSDGYVVDYVDRVSDSTAQSANFEFIANGSVQLPGGSATTGFEFNGLPAQVSLSSKKDLEWLFEQVSQFFGFFAGLIINLIKYSIMGYIIMAESLVNLLLNATTESLSQTALIQNDISYAYVQFADDFYNVEETEYIVSPIKAMSGVEENQEGTENAEDTEDSTDNDPDAEAEAALGADLDYTIEDIIYNNIPLLDVNVFTDTPGGKKVADDSIVGMLRSIVAGWYVSFRNLATIGLALIIVYIGIRIALSTIPEKKAEYKSALLSWVVSLALIWGIHYFMIIAIRANESILNLLENTNVDDTVVYDTILTRAQDSRMHIGFPAMIMYLVLVIYFYKFLWVYIKRYFTVMILIIIAPFVCAKYAFDGAKGKRGTSLSSWMYDFTMNVLLQSVHALLYTSLMSVALSISTESIWGFIIALVFLNFIQKADKIFLDIFNFGKGANVADVDRPFSSKESLAGAFFAYHYTKSFLGFGWRTGKKAVRATGRAATGLYNVGTRAIFQEDAREVRSGVRRRMDSVSEFRDRGINTVYRALHGGKDSEYVELRRLARKGGKVGRDAQRILKAKKDLRSKKYKTGFNIAKTVPLSLLGMAAAVPLTVISPQAGVGTFTKAFQQYRKVTKPKTEIPYHRKRYTGTEQLLQVVSLGTYKGAKAERDDRKKKENKITNTIKYIKQVDTHYDEAQETWDRIAPGMEDKARKKLMDKIKKITVDGSESKVSASVYNYLNVNETREVTRENISDIIDAALDSTGLNKNLTEEQREQVKTQVMNEHDYSENKFISQVENISTEVHRAAFNISFVSEDEKKIASAMDSIEKINAEARKEVKSTVTDTARLIRDMKVKYND